jgi:hypothetical protein
MVGETENASHTEKLTLPTGTWFGRHRGSVRIADGVDLTEPTFDEPTDAETGRELEH